MTQILKAMLEIVSLRRKLGWFEHVFRGESLEKAVMLMMSGGRRSKGSPLVGRGRR